MTLREMERMKILEILQASAVTEQLLPKLSVSGAILCGES